MSKLYFDDIGSDVQCVIDAAPGTIAASSAGFFYLEKALRIAPTDPI